MACEGYDAVHINLYDEKEVRGRLSKRTGGGSSLSDHEAYHCPRDDPSSDYIEVHTDIEFDMSYSSSIENGVGGESRYVMHHTNPFEELCSMHHAATCDFLFFWRCLRGGIYKQTTSLAIQTCW